MPDGLRAGLLLFALLTSLSAVPVLLRRLRPRTLVGLYALGLVVVLALGLFESFGLGDARPLLLPYLVALCLSALGASGPGGSAPVPRAFVRAGGITSALGVALPATSALELRLPLFGTFGLAFVAAAFGGAVSWRCLVLARRAETLAQRRSDQAAAVSALMATLAAVLALARADAGTGLWAVLFGAATALLTSARVRPFTPPTAREGVAALFAGVVLTFAGASRGSPGDAFVYGAEAALVVLAVLAVSRPLLVARALPGRQAAPPPSASAPERQEAGALISEGALAHMSPMLDDALMLRPARPRVNARVTAKRLLEASLERARAAHPLARRAQLAVDVREDDADVDVEGDPGELAEALCAVLDNALCLKREHPALYVRVHVRGSPGYVTFEVSDDLAEQAGVVEGAGPRPTRPFSSARGGERPGLGVGLARAKLLVERHGGELLARRTSEGSCVQLTLPRRRTRSVFGVA